MKIFYTQKMDYIQKFNKLDEEIDDLKKEKNTKEKKLEELNILDSKLQQQRIEDERKVIK